MADMNRHEWIGAVGGIFTIQNFDLALGPRITPAELINSVRYGRQIPRKARKDRSKIKAARKQRRSA